MKQIILLSNDADDFLRIADIEAWTTLTKLCKFHPEFSYHYLKRLNYPFTSHGWTFKKIPLN